MLGRVPFPVFFVILLACGSSGAASDLSGKWLFNANGYLGEMELRQSGETLSGGMHVTSRPEVVTEITGRLSGDSLNFVRSGIATDYPDQTYRGTIVRSGGRKWLVGKFRDPNYSPDFAFNWCAVESPNGRRPASLECPVAEDEPDFKWTRRMD